MGKIQIIIPDELERQIRLHAIKKGDLSRITAEAYALWLKPEAERGADKEIVKEVPVVPTNYVQLDKDSFESSYTDLGDLKVIYVPTEVAKVLKLGAKDKIRWIVDENKHAAIVLKSF